MPQESQRYENNPKSCSKYPPCEIWFNVTFVLPSNGFKIVDVKANLAVVLSTYIIIT